MNAPSDTTAAMDAPSGGRAWIGTALRVAVSVVALALVFARVPFAEVAGAVAHLDLVWLAAAFVAVYAAIAVSALKWDLLLRSRGHRLPFLRLVRHYFVGLFFNNFLPTSIGGDVVRAWDVGRDMDDAAEGAASVIAERLIASVALGLTAALGLPFVSGGREAAFAVAVVLVASCSLVALFFVPTRTSSMVAASMGDRFAAAKGWVGRATIAVRETLRQPGSVLVVLALSIGFQVLVATVNFTLFRALGATVSLGECVVYTSVISAVTMVPVSISGHGVREAGYAYFFALAGVSGSDAVTASLLFFAVVAVSSLPGAPLFAIGRRNR